MAPLPRFHKLEDEKREAILEVAAQEFLEQGFESASFNRIIERTGISKGAMYYYFKDKCDLYQTVIERLAERISQHLGVLSFDDLTKETFWPEMFKLQEKKLGFVVQNQWMMRLWGLGLRLTKQDPTGVMARLYNSRMPLMRAWLERGRALGVVRADMPVELQLQLMMAMGTVIGDWIMENEDWREEVLRERSRTFLEMVRQALTPPDHLLYKSEAEDYR